MHFASDLSGVLMPGSDIAEADWKTLRKLHPILLDRFCRRILDEVTGITANPEKTSHERYLAVWSLLRDRDQDIEDAFNDMRRSRAFFRICGMRSLGLMTDDELAQFSDSMSSAVRSFIGEDKS
jgi:hypothetical protein